MSVAEEKFRLPWAQGDQDEACLLIVDDQKNKTCGDAWCLSLWICFFVIQVGCSPTAKWGRPHTQTETCSGKSCTKLCVCILPHTHTALPEVGYVFCDAQKKASLFCTHNTNCPFVTNSAVLKHKRNPRGFSAVWDTPVFILLPAMLVHEMYPCGWERHFNGALTTKSSYFKLKHCWKAFKEMCEVGVVF